MFKADTIMDGAWTSGSSEGDGCDVERKFAWCPGPVLLNDSQTLDASIWAAPPDGNATTQRCLGLSFKASSATLTRANCTDEKKPFVCQVINRTARSFL